MKDFRPRSTFPILSAVKNIALSVRFYSKECVWSLLTGLLTHTSTPRIIQYINEIEIWILRLLSAPVPVPGKTKLEVRLNPNCPCIYFIFFSPPHNKTSRYLDQASLGPCSVVPEVSLNSQNEILLFFF